VVYQGVPSRFPLSTEDRSHATHALRGAPPSLGGGSGGTQTITEVSQWASQTDCGLACNAAGRSSRIVWGASGRSPCARCLFTGSACSHGRVVLWQKMRVFLCLWDTYVSAARLVHDLSVDDSCLLCSGMPLRCRFGMCVLSVALEADRNSFCVQKCSPRPSSRPPSSGCGAWSTSTTSSARSTSASGSKPSILVIGMLEGS
jgi:hypothetical protein